MKPLFLIRLNKEIETRRRIIVAVAAYAYEFENAPIMSDAEFDKLVKEIDTTIDTDRPDLDEWFRKNFETDTGMWIHKHPELDKIRGLYHEHYASQE